MDSFNKHHVFIRELFKIKTILFVRKLESIQTMTIDTLGQKLKELKIPEDRYFLHGLYGSSSQRTNWP